ncbi:MAG TPA: EfeM/EfeO family lipoprotein [Parvibaculum sp.]
MRDGRQAVGYEAVLKKRAMYSAAVAVLVLGACLALGAGSAHADDLADGAKAFKPFVIEEVGKTLKGAEALQKAVDAGDAKAAQKAWIDARVGWESIEVVTGEFFPDLDEAIDTWPDAKAGFHAIEAALFAGDVEDIKPAVDELGANVQAFDKKVNDPAYEFTPQGILNGTAGLAYEVGENKSKGGESPYSGNSLADMRYNIHGIHVAYDVVFEQPLRAKDNALGQKADDEIHALEAMLKKAKNLQSIDVAALRKTSENLAVDLQEAAGKLGLEKPNLGE